MPVPEELDVFFGPHKYMKSLVKDVENTITTTKLTTYDEFAELLRHLSQRFHIFKAHEEIENFYILQPLLPRLERNVKTTLENDLHSGSRLRDILTQVDSALQSSDNWFALGEQLKRAIIEFTMAFIPHMKEEEEIFLPLLLEYFTETELKALTIKVLELHNLSNSCTLLNLPPEILITVLSYLSPIDLCRLSQVHPLLTQFSFHGKFWDSLHPIRWANGHWKFFPSLCGNEFNHEEIVENNILKELLSHELIGVKDENVRYSRESRIFEGLMKYLLPKVGCHVRTLDLSYSIAITSAVAREIFALCPNICYLDVSNTAISDDAFVSGVRQSLQYIDLAGCSMIGDSAILGIAKACSAWLSLHDSCSHSVNIESHIDERKPLLKCLILSDCILVTDNGLRGFTLGEGLPYLTYLDLSGIPHISASLLFELVTVCPNLSSEFLFYCDNIEMGPYPLNANGCQDVRGSGCCRNGFKT